MGPFHIYPNLYAIDLYGKFVTNPKKVGHKNPGLFNRAPSNSTYKDILLGQWLNLFSRENKVQTLFSGSIGWVRYTYNSRKNAMDFKGAFPMTDPWDAWYIYLHEWWISYGKLVG